MSIEQLAALAGMIAGIGGFIALILGIYLRLSVTTSERNLYKELAAQATAFSERLEVLHGRINDVKDQYVKRADLAEHLQRIESSQDRLAAKVDRMTESIVPPLINLAKALVDRP